MSKLSTAMPAPALVDAYLKEIALAYGVPWLSADEASTNTNGTAQEAKDDDLTTKDPEKNNVSIDNSSQTTVTTSDAVTKSGDHKKPFKPAPPPEDDFESLAKRFADLKKR